MSQIKKQRLGSVLVTGAAGGIGSVLVPGLLRAGFHVLALDDLSSGDWQNIQPHHNLRKITGSILDQSILDEAVTEDVHWVIHLAAISSLPECQLNPEKALDTNLRGTMLLALRSTNLPNLKLFINASTSAIYESNKEDVLLEDSHTNPHLIYSQTKKWSEDFLHSMYTDRNFPSVSFRFFNVFGPMQNYSRKSPPLLNYLLSNFVNQKKSTLHSTGFQKRDYISVNDVVEQIIASLDHKFAEQRIFNLCSGRTMSVLDLVAAVEFNLQKKLDIEFRPAEKLWDAYGDLFAGNYPLRVEVIENETNKTSLGSPAALIEELGAKLRDQEEELQKVISEALTYLRSRK